ncbi:MAG TPA: hypothetical protein VIF37_14525 [Methylobacter sp.]|jgi:hypothetical protein
MTIKIKTMKKYLLLLGMSYLGSGVAAEPATTKSEYCQSTISAKIDNIFETMPLKIILTRNVPILLARR